MDHYLIWFELRSGVHDLDFVDAVDAWLGHLAAERLIEGHTLARRKLGFGPDGLGDWLIDIRTRDLAQLESAFQRAATRTGEAEALHSAVFTKVERPQFGLYRDFPDAVRRD